MDGNRQLFWFLVLVGIVVILASIFAHQLGIGNPGFGTKKLAGVIVGAALLLIGLWGALRAYGARVA